MGAFLRWHNSYFNSIRVAPENSTCGPVTSLVVNGLRLGILCINSALFCQGDDDHERLWVGRRSLSASLSDLRALDSDVNIVLIHHPLEWLNPGDAVNIQAELESSAHILLRGHLHATRLQSVASPEGEILHCAAGAAYDSRKLPNRALYGTLTARQLTIFPISYVDAPKELWTADPSVFPHNDNFERTFPIPQRRSEAPESQPSSLPSRTPPRFRSNIKSRGNLPFVGREELVAQISEKLNALGTEKVVILHGPPGVGKSELAREFGRRNRDRYSGGTFVIDASTEAIAINLAEIGTKILDLSFQPNLPINDQGQQTLYSLTAAPVLIIYDNVPSFERITTWLPLAGMPCHVLITTIIDVALADWPCLEVKPLSHEQSLELVSQLTGGALAPVIQDEIATRAGGLPVQIVPEAVAMIYDQRRGRLRNIRGSLTREAGNSFRAAYDRLEFTARLLLHAAAFLDVQRILVAELTIHLCDGLGWSEADVSRALDTCLDFHLLEGAPDPRMHQLLAAFLRDIVPAPQDQEQLARVWPIQAKRFASLAEAVRQYPADTRTATAFISYPLVPETWAVLSEPLTAEGLTIGHALFEIGRYNEARLWFEREVAAAEMRGVRGQVDHGALGKNLYLAAYCLRRAGQFVEARPGFERAVAEAQKGDLQGRIDHENLGSSLHQVGDCLSRTGKSEEARPWYERAVAEKQKGDTSGRIDHSSLGGSMHELGYCLSRMGQDAEARLWYERAVAQKEKGDVRGQIDHAGLGISLHQVGYSLSRMGQFTEAQYWFERAVAEAEKGDVYGRVDHANLGISLHQIGDCLTRSGNFAEARPWFERAVAEAEKGDVHGRVDHANLGISLHQVGYCLSLTQQYAEARQWYERAVAELSKGDRHGRVDHSSLGVSLHQVGMCISSLGNHGQALPWFERAATEAKKGDTYGLIDHESLGMSLNQVGDCLANMGDHANAREWFQRAVAAAEQGDTHGRIDHESVGSSLHQDGESAFQLGNFIEAQSLFERAAVEKEKGDLYKRRDRESIGRSLSRVGDCLASLGRDADARLWFERAVAEAEMGDIHGRSDPEIFLNVLQNAAACLQRLKEFDRANELRSKASKVKHASALASSLSR